MQCRTAACCAAVPPRPLSARARAPLLPASLGGGFGISFELAYSREDVFRELNRVYRPLGVNGAEVHYQVVGEPIAAPQSAAGGGASGQQDDGFRLGMRREVKFSSSVGGKQVPNRILSELVAFTPGSFVKWKQLESDCAALNFVGSNGTAPEVSIALADTKSGGTAVHLKYDFKVADIQPTGLAACLPWLREPPESAVQELRKGLEEGVPRRWSSDMATRGYVRVDAAGVRGAPAGVAQPTVVGPGEQSMTPASAAPASSAEPPAAWVDLSHTLASASQNAPPHKGGVRKILSPLAVMRKATRRSPSPSRARV